MIDEINLSDNTDLLEELFHFLTLENETGEVYILNKQQNAAIEEARNQIKNGNYLTNEQANQEIDAWLKNNLV